MADDPVELELPGASEDMRMACAAWKGVGMCDGLSLKGSATDSVYVCVATILVRQGRFQGAQSLWVEEPAEGPATL